VKQQSSSCFVCCCACLAAVASAAASCGLVVADAAFAAPVAAVVSWPAGLTTVRLPDVREYPAIRLMVYCSSLVVLMAQVARK